MPPPRVHRHRYHGVLARIYHTRPLVCPAGGPPALELGFGEPSADGMDQTPAVDPAEPEPIPRYEMDQSPQSDT